MHHQGGVFTGVQNIELYYQCWLPDREPHAVLILVHGLAEHSGRYANLIHHFLPLGYAVCGFDLPGHGKSDGIRGHVDRFEDFTDALKTFAEMIREQHPDKPFFLVGHSMGGLIAAAYLFERQAELAGAVLSAPSIKSPGHLSRLVVFSGKLLSMLAPRLGLIRLEAEGVCKDTSVVQAYLSDPLVYKGKISARMGAELLKTMQRIVPAAERITIPILILQGSADRLVDPDGARVFYDAIGSADRQLKVYDGLYHEVFNEPENAKVFTDVSAWIAKHLR